MKLIIWRTENTLKRGDRRLVTTVIERTVVKNVEDNPKKMASMGIASTYANAHNINKLTETLEQLKGKMAEMKAVLKKEKRVYRESKRKYEDTLSNYEDLENKIAEMETQKSTAKYKAGQ